MWKPFNTNILNSILYTNKKSLKIGYCEHDRCSFCDKESETFHHLFFFCLYSNILCKHFENYYFTIAKRVMALSLRDIITGITTLLCPLINYLILVGKMYIWDCRRRHANPNTEGFKLKMPKVNYQTEKDIATKNKDLETFYKKWTENFPL